MTSLRAFLFVAVVFGTVLPNARVCAETPKESSTDATPSEAVPRTNRKKGGGGMGNDIKKLGEQVASRIDRIIKKKTFELWGDPWQMQGLPLIFPSSTTGFNLGLKIALQNVLRQDPHELELEAQILTSERGRYKHFFKFDAPHAFNDRVRLTARLSYDRDIALMYYGQSNDTVIDFRSLAVNSPDYQNIRSGPTLNVQALYRFSGYWRVGPVFQLRSTDVTYPNTPSNLLAQQQPSGVNGGKTHGIGIALVRDELDWEPYPSRGSYHEFVWMTHGNLTGSNFAFNRATYTYKRYFLIHRRLIFAHRTLFEVLDGDVPFFEMSSIGGLNPSLAFGGERFLRGFEGAQFLDKIRTAMGFELRWDPLFFPFARQDFTLGFVPWVDIARVWPSVFPLRLGGWHVAGGWGVRLIWNSRLVIRGDLSFSSNGTEFLITLGNAF